MVITRIGPVSLAKTAGVIYAVLGLIIGAIVSLFAALGAAFANGAQGTGMAAFIGVGAVVFLPIVYGCLGFIGMLIFAWLYNAAAGWVGGVEVTIQ